jgi:hypothetical protein
MYDKGQGVPQDYVQAHMWFNLSAAQGEQNAVKGRDMAAQSMTPAQIAEAQKTGTRVEADYGAASVAARPWCVVGHAGAFITPPPGSACPARGKRCVRPRAAALRAAMARWGFDIGAEIFLQRLWPADVEQRVHGIKSGQTVAGQNSAISDACAAKCPDLAAVL